MRALLLMAVLAACNRADNPVVRKWLADWEAARACMLSSPEYGPDGATASAVSALLQDTSCHRARLELLVFDDEDRSKIPNWGALRQEIDQLKGTAGDGPVIDRIDALSARLRAAAELPPIKRARERTVTPLPPGRSITIAGTDLGPRMGVEFQPGRLVVDHGPIHAEATSLDEVRSWSVKPGYDLAYPSRAWIARARDSVLTVVDLDGGKPSEIQLPAEHEYSSSRALDAGSTRAVVLQSMKHGGGFAVAVSTDGGRKWRVHRSDNDLPLVATSQDLETGIVDAVVHSGGYAHIHRFDQLEPFRFPARFDIPRFEHPFDCRHGGVLWAMEAKDTRVLYRVSREGSRTFELSNVYPWGVADCRGTAALVLRRGMGEVGLDLCRGDSCRTVHEPKHRGYGAAALLEDGSWVYAATINGVVGVWRENRLEPTFHRLAAADTGDEIAAISVLSGEPYLVIVVADRYRFVIAPN
ncbi:MAG TPA: hypothetical protein VIU61_27815 [Kofleriaceae bacterium]